METSEPVTNIIRDKFKNVTYEIVANRKLTHNEMLRQVRYYWFDPNRDRPKPGGRIRITVTDE